MAARKEVDGDSFWLWDGEAEYEGVLLTHREAHVTARIRLVRRWSLAEGSPGKPVLLNFLERQRRLTQAPCFAQSPAVHPGALLELRVDTVQRSRDRQFDFLLGGTVSSVADEHLDELSRLTPEGAAFFLRGRRSNLA